VVTINFSDGQTSLQRVVEKPRGLDPPVTNEEIITKYRKLTSRILSESRQKQIAEMVLSLEKVEDVTRLTNLLSEPFQKKESVQ
jgi:aconitate decarboxylase